MYDRDAAAERGPIHLWLQNEELQLSDFLSVRGASLQQRQRELQRNQRRSWYLSG